MNETNLVDENGQLRPEIKEKGLELVGKIANVCKDYDPALALFVLEAILTEMITAMAPPLGELFTDMLQAYKKKAQVLLHVLEVLQTASANNEPEEGSQIN